MGSRHVAVYEPCALPRRTLTLYLALLRLSFHLACLCIGVRCQTARVGQSLTSLMWVLHVCPPHQPCAAVQQLSLCKLQFSGMCSRPAAISLHIPVVWEAAPLPHATFIDGMICFHSPTFSLVHLQATSRRICTGRRPKKSWRETCTPAITHVRCGGGSKVSVKVRTPGLGHRISQDSYRVFQTAIKFLIREVSPQCLRSEKLWLPTFSRTLGHRLEN